jgi:hypothetical protein
MANKPEDVLKMLVQLTELTQKIEQLGGTVPAQQPAAVAPAPAQPVAKPTVTPAHGVPAVGGPGSPRTLEELLVGLTERLEQFASQSEERGRRMEKRLERIEELLAGRGRANDGD